ncbi:MAG: hypothetical protein LBB53_01290 [Prevotellaceae bacterium]|jgi:hypothetical protein|nr:hypothetical protein [Prevotellaceae bacterium]
MALFDLSEISARQNTGNSLIYKYEQIHTRKINNINDLVGSDFLENHIWFLWTQNSFNAFTFILYAIKNIGIIEELVLTTYSINEKVIELLVRWYDRKMIKRVIIFISDTVKVRNSKLNDLLVLQSQNRDIMIIYAWNHSKIMLIKTEYKHICIEGSGNLSDNSRYENYTLINNKEVYDFRKECVLHNS